MKRLTNNVVLERMNEFPKDYTFSTEELIYQKLGELEDIEQELGIDLITLFRAVMKGFWLKTQFSCYLVEPLLELDEYVIDLASSRLLQLDDEFRYVFHFKDYGKTWALTKEELENDKD